MWLVAPWAGDVATGGAGGVVTCGAVTGGNMSCGAVTCGAVTTGGVEFGTVGRETFAAAGVCTA